jgi:hypothetical protein
VYPIAEFGVEVDTRVYLISASLHSQERVRSDKEARQSGCAVKSWRGYLVGR